ncbi:MAG: methylenetetrahydrofolate reductase [Desulfovibrionaceae bacterium]
MQIPELIAQRTGKFLSLEFFPPKEREVWPRFFEVVQQLRALDPLFASVTYGAGGGTQDNTLEIVRRMKAEAGVEPMAHLTLVGATRERIRDFLGSLVQAEVHNVLALRGDPPRDKPDFDFSKGEFASSIELMRFIREEFPAICPAGTAYPEPHPETVSITAGLDWALAKAEAGAGFFVTQLFFDNRFYFDYVERLAAKGCSLPVLPGVMPIMSIKSAKFLLSLCGAAIPGKFLAALEAADESGPEEVRRVGLDYATRQAQELLDSGVPGVHLYTLNQAQACLEIGNNLTL